MKHSETELPITEDAAAKLIGVTVATMRKWRCIGKGPSFIKYGRSRAAMVRYLPSVVLAFRDSYVVER